MFRTLFLMVTEDCNLRCSYCYEASKSRRYMGPGDAEEAIELLFKQDGPLGLEIYGGEPLLNPKTTMAALKYARLMETKTGKRCRVSISTNATLINEEMIEMLEEFDAVQLSIDGIEKAHDMNRVTEKGKGSYHMIEPWLRDLASHSINTQISMAVSPDNVKYMADGVIQMYSLGFKKVKINPVKEIEWSNRNFDTYERQLKIIADYVVSSHKSGSPVELNIFTQFIGLNPIGGDYSCGTGTSCVAVVPGGVIYPCLRYYTIDRNNKSKKHAIGSTVRGITKEFAPCKRVEMRPCNECDVEQFCMRCMAMNVEITHDAGLCPTFCCELTKINKRVGEQVKQRIQDGNQIEELKQKINDLINENSEISAIQQELKNSLSRGSTRIADVENGLVDLSQRLVSFIIRNQYQGVEIDNGTVREE